MDDDDIDLDEEPEVVVLRENTRPAATGERTKKKRKVDHRGRHWFLTWNNYRKAEDVRILLQLGARKYAFQEETGDNKTKHLQGVFSFKNAKLWSTLDKKTGGHAFWEPCKNVLAARTYCQKERSRTGEQWLKGMKMGGAKLKDPLEGKTPYVWQQEILDMCQEDPDERKIYWYWSTKGRVGKSALIKHLCMTEGAQMVGGKFNDAFYAIKSEIEAKRQPFIVLFDLPRSMGSKISYVAMENIKNGCIFNAKYESGMLLFNSPHMIVMANVPPDTHMMSPDRWVIKCLDYEEDLAHI